MTLAAVAGWVCALAALGVATLAVARLRAQAVAVARAAHELRGGLCVARLALDAASPDGARLQLDRARRALADLDRAADASAELVDISALVRTVAAAWPSVRVTVPRRPLIVRGERAALAQACANLVANAVEHGAPPVEIRARRAGDRLRVEVADGGAGLPAPVAALVASARKRRGRRGHGLAIAGDVAARHRGRLGTAPGAGATLVLELPAEPGDAA